MEYFKINLIVNAFTIEIAGFRFVLEVLEAIVLIFFKSHLHANLFLWKFYIDILIWPRNLRTFVPTNINEFTLFQLPSIFFSFSHLQSHYPEGSFQIQASADVLESTPYKLSKCIC